jgi:hypothetical protein
MKDPRDGVLRAGVIGGGILCLIACWMIGFVVP